MAIRFLIVLLLLSAGVSAQQTYYFRYDSSHFTGKVKARDIYLDSIEAFKKRYNILSTSTGFRTINGLSIIGSGDINFDTVNLSKRIDGKLDTGANFSISKVTNLQSELDGKQPTLVSGTTLRTVNGNSLLGPGNITIESGSANLVNLSEYTIGGSSDATSAIQAAFNAVSSDKPTLFVPDGTYVISSTIFKTGDNWNLVMSPGAKFKAASTFGGSRMFSFKGNNITIDGGTFEGNWDSTQYMSSTGGKITGQILVAFVAENVSNFLNLTIKNCTFINGGETGLLISNSKNTRTENLKILNNKFIANWRSLYVINSIDSVNGKLSWGVMKDVVIKGNYCRKTAAPPAGIWDGWAYGGNALSVYGYYENLYIEENKVEECGRMALEVFSGPHLDTEIYPKKLWILNNVLLKSRNRTFSIVAEDAYVANNYIEDSASFHEVGGYNHTYIGNTFVGGHGVYVGRNAMPTKVGHTKGTVHYKFIGNTFRGMVQGHSAIWATNTKDVVFSYNDIIYDSTSLPDPNDYKAAITISKSYNVDASNNTIRYRNTTIRSALAALDYNQLLKFNYNKFIVDTTAILDSSIYKSSIIVLKGHNKSQFIGNSVDIPYSVWMWDGVVYPISENPLTLNVRKWNGTSYDSTNILSTGVANDPPASPATNATYLIGDNPTGVWVGKPRQLATWNGSAWTYVVPKDILWEYNPNRFSFSNLPNNGQTVGDTYVMTSGMIDNVFRDNQWDKNKSVKTESTKGVYTIWSTNSQGITYNNLWQNDTKPKLARGRVWYDKYTPYAADYKNASSELISSSGSTDTTSLSNRINSKQDALVSGTNIKTINGSSVLGSGNLSVGVDTSSLSSRIDLKVNSNSTITGATKTKITYDSKGLVTAGADLVESDIPTLSQSKIANLTTDLAGKASTSHTHAISNITSLQTTLDSKVDKNTSITGSTKTKITYDSKGLVIGGVDLVESDIPSLSQSKISGLVAALDSKLNSSDTSSISNRISTLESSSLNIPISINEGYELKVDFDGSFSPFSLGTANSATVAAQAQTSISGLNRPGVYYLGTNSNATARAWISTPATIYSFGGGEWEARGSIYIDVLSNSTNRFSDIFGFADNSASVDQTDGIYFLYDEGGVSTGSAASENWQIVIASNGVRNFTTTSVPVEPNTWYNFNIVINSDATQVNFYINGVNVGSYSSGIPSGYLRSTGFLIMKTKTIGTSNRVTNVDWVKIKSIFTTSR